MVWTSHRIRNKGKSLACCVLHHCFELCLQESQGWMIRRLHDFFTGPLSKHKGYTCDISVFLHSSCSCLSVFTVLVHFCAVPMHSTPSLNRSFCCTGKAGDVNLGLRAVAQSTLQRLTVNTYRKKNKHLYNNALDQVSHSSCQGIK